MAVCHDPNTGNVIACTAGDTYNCTISGGSSGRVGWANPGAQMVLLSAQGMTAARSSRR